MKSGYTHLVMILDRSGSMADTASDAIGGFNQFIEDQKKAPGEATLSLVQFDNEYEVVHSFKSIKDIEPLTRQTFQPRGTTALLDAIGRTVNETGETLAKRNESERPERVIVVVITDGMENASREFLPKQINQIISHQREAYKWDFLFIGANQDAITSAKELGISMKGALSYAANSQGTRSAYTSLSASVLKARAVGGQSVGNLGFDGEAWELQRKAGVK